MIGWAFAVLIYAALVLLVAVTGDQNCPVTAGSSDYGALEFNIFPPGYECRFVDPVTGDEFVTDRPGPLRMLTQLAVVAVPIAAWWSTTRLRDGTRERRRNELLIVVTITAALIGLGGLMSTLLHGPRSYDAVPLVLILGSAVVVTAGVTLLFVSYTRWLADTIEPGEQQV